MIDSNGVEDGWCHIGDYHDAVIPGTTFQGDPGRPQHAFCGISQVGGHYDPNIDYSWCPECEKREC